MTEENNENQEEFEEENEDIENAPKTPLEIRQIIQDSLTNNKILGYLNNNFLYMKSFGRDSTPDKIMISVGFIIFYFGMPGKHQTSVSQVEIIMIIVGLILMAIGGIVSWLVKHYLVYDIDREVFYTITNLHNFTLFRSKEVARKDIVELGVDVTDKNEKNQTYNEVLHPKKGLELIDNPGLKTSFVALNPEGKKINISDPVALRQPHEAAVARCQLFSQCFGVPAVICNKNEALKIVKDENNLNKFEKFSKEPEWEKARKTENRVAWILLIGFLVFIAAIFYFIFYGR